MRALPLVIVLLACRTQPLPEPDGGADLAAASNLLPIQAFSVDDLNLCPLDLIRATFTVVVGTCQTPGPAHVSYDAANNHYTVSATVITTGTCSGMQTLTRTVILSDVARPSPGVVTVSDANGPATLTLDLQPVLADGKCGSVGDPAACRADSDCDPRLRCYYDGNQCVLTCFDDTGCSGATPKCSRGICINGGGQ